MISNIKWLESELPLNEFFNEVFQDKEVVLSEEHTEISWADASDSKLLIPAFLDLQKMLDETIQLVNDT